MRAVPRSPAAARQQDEIADPATSRGTCGGVSAVWQCGGKSDSMDINDSQLPNWESSLVHDALL